MTKQLHVLARYIHLNPVRAHVAIDLSRECSGGRHTEIGEHFGGLSPAAGASALWADRQGNVGKQAMGSAGAPARPQSEGRLRTLKIKDATPLLTTVILGNSSTVTHAYDGASRITGVRNAKSDGTTMSSFQYSLDDVGNPTGMALANGDIVTWSYDNVNRLTPQAGTPAPLQHSGANG